MLPTKGEQIVCLQKKNVGLIVNLTEYEYDFDVKNFIEDYENKALKYEAPRILHIPIIDNTPPQEKQIQLFLTNASKAVSNNKAVACHCAAGKGQFLFIPSSFFLFHNKRKDRWVEMKLFLFFQFLSKL